MITWIYEEVPGEFKLATNPDQYDVTDLNDGERAIACRWQVEEDADGGAAIAALRIGAFIHSLPEDEQPKSAVLFPDLSVDDAVYIATGRMGLVTGAFSGRRRGGRLFRADFDEETAVELTTPMQSGKNAVSSGRRSFVEVFANIDALPTWLELFDMSDATPDIPCAGADLF